MRFAILVLALALASTTALKAKVIGKTIDYSADTVSLKGYLAYDDAVTGKRPGIVVVHEWWGITDYPKMRADMLAKLGYVAFAADMYGNGKTADNPADAQKYAGESMKDMAALKAKFLAAVEILKNNEHVDPNQIAAIGYCYGGGVVLNMARAGVDLKGVVSFHGNLTTSAPAQKGDVKAKVLVCNGGADKFETPKIIDDFKSEMKHADVDFKFVSYKGALHAFSNPEATALGKKFNIPIAYNKKADTGSWTEMKKFFKMIFKG